MLSQFSCFHPLVSPSLARPARKGGLRMRCLPGLKYAYRGPFYDMMGAGLGFAGLDHYDFNYLRFSNEPDRGLIRISDRIPSTPLRNILDCGVPVAQICLVSNGNRSYLAGHCNIGGRVERRQPALRCPQCGDALVEMTLWSNKMCQDIQPRPQNRCPLCSTTPWLIP